MSNQRTVTTQARLLRPLASVLLAAGLASPLLTAAEGPRKDPNFPNADQSRAYLAEGVNLYRAGRYKDAAVALRAALAQQPEDRLVYEFYLACGDALLVRMQDQDVLEDVLKDILRRARIYQKQLRRDAAYVNLLMAKLESSEEERQVASRELSAIGPWAIPHLVAALADSPQEERRTNCRVVLTMMGGRAVIPLCTALASSDERQVASAALALGDISDARALPALVRTAAREGLKDTTRQVLSAAIANVAARAKIADISAVQPLHLAEAVRYLRGGPEVRDEVIAASSMMWRWDDAAAGPAKLSFVRVPAYAWNELMAEETLFQGMAADPAFAGFQPVLAAAYAAQAVEAEQRQLLAKERTMPAAAPEDTQDAIAERVAALGEAMHRVRMTGAENICRAVAQALASERYEVACALLRVLEDRHLARPKDILPTSAQELTPEKPGSVLISALDHPEKRVRYQAAITLAALDPTAGKTVDLPALKALVAKLDESVTKDTEKVSAELMTQLKAMLDGCHPFGFYGAEKVVPTLAQALGEWGVRVVLVVDPDYRQRNAARAALQAKGFLVITAADGFEAVNRLGESPVKDAVIVAGDLGPSFKDDQGVLIDVPQQSAFGLVTQVLASDPRLGGAPVFVSLPDDPEKAAAVQKTFDGKMPGNAGFVAKPFDAVELHDKIDAGLKKAQITSANQAIAEDIARRAAVALQQPDLLRTALDLDTAGDALAATLAARADPIRIEALKAIGHIAGSPRGDGLKRLASRLTDGYGAQDAELEKNAALRAAWVFAIGHVDATSDAAIGILKKALQHADPGVRAAAAGAVGALPTIPPQLLTAFQVQQRLDARSPGAGKE